MNEASHRVGTDTGPRTNGKIVLAITLFYFSGAALAYLDNRIKEATEAASDAQSTAEEAQSAAESAQSAAEEAQSAAEKAQSTAENLRSY